MLLARSYSHYSLLKAVPKVPALVEAAKKAGYTTMSLTDLDTAANMIDFEDACEQNEVKYAPGADLHITPITKLNDVEHKRIALIATSEKGYKHILYAVTIARTEREEPVFHIEVEDLIRNQEPLECLVVLCHEAHEFYTALRNDEQTALDTILRTYIQNFGASNILLETFFPTSTLNESETQRLNLKLFKIAETYGVKVIVSPAPRYLTTDQEEAYRIIQAIGAQTRIGSIETQRSLQLYTVEELKLMFDYLPDSIWDTQEIEDRISVYIRKDYDKHADEAFFPNFVLPEGQEYASRLRWETYINFLDKFDPRSLTRLEWMDSFPYEKLLELQTYSKTIIPDPAQLLGYEKGYWRVEGVVLEYIDRMQYELDVIIQKGFPSYFLVFADIMQFCRDSGIVASTRGSAAGSLVGYLMNINILDPLIYKLPFERFLNPLRPSAPDIDGDFADDRRGEVIKYITEKYGSENVTQIITFGTMLPRAVVRDVGRALGVSYTKCDKLAKIIPTPPQGKKATFKWAFESSEELVAAYDNDTDVRRIVDIARVIEGNFRHASSHAAGVVISPSPMYEFGAIQWDSDHQGKIIQYDMRIVEKVGLIKLDILGIRNLAILGNAIDLTEERRHVNVDLLNLDTTDKKTFSVLARGRTMGIFQLAGPAMTRYLVDMEPNKVTDLMAMVALYRPGPMANIPDYIKRKKNPKTVKYYVPQMKEWMESSYGVLVYQDDLLYTVINLAGYDWGMADVFRKGVGKKIPEVLESQHAIFVDGAIAKSGLTREKAEEIWDIMVPFAAYGFNKAHATNYGMVAYWTAFMKANYPAEFMTALMSAEASNLEKIGVAIRECQELHIDVLPPDVNKSFQGFYIEDDKTIRYGLESVKNLGSDVIKQMIEERKNGEFSTLQDFIERMANTKSFNKRSLEALIWSGALDTLGKQQLAHVAS